MEKELLTKVQNELGSDYAHFYQLKDYPHILLQEWKGFCMPKEIKNGHQEVIDLVTEHKFIHLISVIVELEGAFDEVNEWFLKEFNPKMVALEMTYEAIIQSENLFSQLSAEELVENSELKEIGYSMRIFDSVEKIWSGLMKRKITKIESNKIHINHNLYFLKRFIFIKFINL